jgi:hypothetical protein
VELDLTVLEGFAVAKLFKSFFVECRRKLVGFHGKLNLQERTRKFGKVMMEVLCCFFNIAAIPTMKIGENCCENEIIWSWKVFLVVSTSSLREFCFN